MRKKEKVVRPERFELPAFWFVGCGSQNLKGLSGATYKLRNDF